MQQAPTKGGADLESIELLRHPGTNAVGTRVRRKMFGGISSGTVSDDPTPHHMGSGGDGWHGRGGKDELGRIPIRGKLMEGAEMELARAAGVVT